MSSPQRQAADLSGDTSPSDTTSASELTIEPAFADGHGTGAAADRAAGDDGGLTDREVEQLRQELGKAASPAAALEIADSAAADDDTVRLLLAGQSELIAMCARSAGRDEMLHHIADLAERAVDSAYCSIELVDPSSGALSYLASPTLSIDDLTANNNHQIGSGASPNGRAAYSGETVIIADIESEPVADAFRAFADRQGIRASWSHPVLSPHPVSEGAITIYRRDPGAPTERDRFALETLANMAQFVVQTAKRQDALIWADERFTSLAASIPGVVYQRLVTPDGDIRYTYISDGVRELFGVSPEEVLANPQVLFDCHGPQYRETFRERLQEASRTLTMWDVEAQIITRDGREKWTHAIARPHRRPDGAVQWDGIVLDQTRIKEAELDLRKAMEVAEDANRAKSELLEILRTADERFTSLAASIPGVVYQRIVTPDGDIRYTYISEGARDLFGVSPEEILANPQVLFDCHGPQYRTQFRQRLLEASRKLTMWDVEAQIITRDGEEKWTHAIARPHRRADGAVLWDGIILDATRIKQAEFELRKAKEVAESANRAKSQFLATMSHELRTPLNAIIGFSEIIKGETFGPVGSPRYREYACDIFESGEHLLLLINDILDLCKVENGKDELAEKVIEVPALLQSSATLVRERAEVGEVALKIDVADDPPRLFVDQRKLKQILVNLLSNAIKFTEPGGAVTLKAWSRPDSGYVFQVIDNGIGIALGDIPKALSQFGQVEGDLNRNYEGVGIGLPLAKALTELHGGSLDLQSEIGVGTTVTVRLPSERLVPVPDDSGTPDTDDRMSA